MNSPLFCRQSLSIEGFSRDVILNTHFSQKVYSATKAAGVCVPGGDARRPYPLGETFGPLEETAAKQVRVLLMSVESRVSHSASGSKCVFGDLQVICDTNQSGANSQRPPQMSSVEV